LTIAEEPPDDSATTNGNRTPQINRQRAEPINAGDQMSRRNRSIGQVRSGTRYTNASASRTTASIERQNNPTNAYAELDSHADTVVAGSSCKIIELTNQSCKVYPYADHYEPITSVPVAKVATAYDHPISGETFILIFEQALYMGDRMSHTLIFPNQARTNGVIVDDVPQHLSHDNSSTHSIYFPNEQIRLPLCLRGIISYLPTRYPTDSELNECRWLVVTNDTPWNPYDESFIEHEQAFISLQDDDYHRPFDDREIMSFHTAIFR